MCVAFASAKATHVFATHIFPAKILAYWPYAIFNDQSFKDTLNNDIVSFEHLGPDILGLPVLNCITDLSSTFWASGSL